MCDCAETFHRKCCPRTDDEEPGSDSRPPPPEHSKALVLALSALLCGVFGYLLYSLDRRTVKKILTMLGLGFLFAQPTTTINKSEATRKPCMPKPNPCLKRPDPVESKEIPGSTEPKNCKCKENKPPSEMPPPPPPSCRPPAPPPTCLPPPPEKKCKCCPNA